jgi:formylglycine-generating enzyme required for sulfatase activity
MNTPNTTQVVIPAAEFSMGISKSQAEKLAKEFYASSPASPGVFFAEVPEHKVKLKSFGIMRTEVTNAEYKQFVDAGGYTRAEYWSELVNLKNLNADAVGFALVETWVDQTGHLGPATWSNGTFPAGKDAHPVEGVSYFEAAAYAKWKKARLPTEAEWEYAARGADGRIYPWGNQPEVWLKLANAQTSTTPVGSLPEDKSAFGLFDMARNVAEWTSSVYAPYQDSPLPALEAPDANFGVARGGMVGSAADQMRTTWRRRLSRLERRTGVGFRLAVDH